MGLEAAPSSAFPQNKRTVFAKDSGVAKRCISLPIVLTMMIIHDESRFPPPSLSPGLAQDSAPSLPLPSAPVALAQGFSPPDHDQALAVGLSRGISVARNNGCKTETRL